MGAKVEVLGYLVASKENLHVNSADENKKERSLILIAQIVRDVQELNLYFYQLSILSRRKVFTSVNIIC